MLKTKVTDRPRVGWVVYSLLTKFEIYIYMKCVTCHYNKKINNNNNNTSGSTCDPFVEVLNIVRLFRTVYLHTYVHVVCE